MATLRDIATHTQLSTATVSRALRRHPNVDPATAERVLAAAEELGYSLSPRISNLMSYVRGQGATSFRETLGFIWPDAAEEEVNRAYQLRRFEAGAVSRARQLGYGMDVFYPDFQKARWQRLGKILRARGIRGLVWGPFLRSSRAHLTMPLDDFACASIGEAIVSPRLSHARFDHFVGMRTALHQLKKQGCHRVALAMDYSLNVRATPILVASFLAAHSGRGVTGVDLCYTPDTLTFEGLLAWARQTRPDAILLSHEINSMLELPSHPEITWPLKMASLNRLHEVTRFSGIDQRQDLIASHACDLVIEQFNRNELGVPKINKIVLVEGEWRNAGK